MATAISIIGVDLTCEIDRGPLDHVHVGASTPTDIEEQKKVKRGFRGLELFNFLLSPIFVDEEVILDQVGNASIAAPIADGDIEIDPVDVDSQGVSALERGLILPRVQAGWRQLPSGVAVGSAPSLCGSTRTERVVQQLPPPPAGRGRLSCETFVTGVDASAVWLEGRAQLAADIPLETVGVEEGATCPDLSLDRSLLGGDFLPPGRFASSANPAPKVEVVPENAVDIPAGGLQSNVTAGLRGTSVMNVPSLA